MNASVSVGVVWGIFSARGPRRGPGEGHDGFHSGARCGLVYTPVVRNLLSGSVRQSSMCALSQPCLRGFQLRMVGRHWCSAARTRPEGLVAHTLRRYRFRTARRPTRALLCPAARFGGAWPQQRPSSGRSSDFVLYAVCGPRRARGPSTFRWAGFTYTCRGRESRAQAAAFWPGGRLGAAVGDEFNA